jgi:protease-4
MDARLPSPRRVAVGASRAVRRGLDRAFLPRAGLLVRVRLDASQGEQPGPPRRRDAPASLLEALLVLRACAHDPGVVGVLLHLDPPLAGWSAALSLRRAVAELRARGVPVAAFAEQLDEVSLLVASAATRIFMPETGRVHLVGVRAEGFYLRELLSRFDVVPEVVRIGSHKSAAEMFTRDNMSSEQREQQEELVGCVYDALVAAIAEGRGIAPAGVRDRIDRGPYTAAAAREAGLVDALAYPDEIGERLRSLCAGGAGGGPPELTPVDARVYRALRAHPGAAGTVGRLAYVVAQGGIRRGASARGIGSDDLARTLEEVRADPEVRGVTLRIDSPGGDALASDLLWRAVDRLRREKPVVASLAEVAASGGYYLACAADAIHAEVASVTGSIGVIGGKLNLAGLYRRLGVARDGVERGERAGLLSEARSFTPAERGALRQEMEALYAAFVDRVARGRGIAVDAVSRAAGGRVWSGDRALRIGLVDAIGGPLEALDHARRLAGLLPGEQAALALHPRAPRLGGLVYALRWLR